MFWAHRLIHRLWITPGSVTLSRLQRGDALADQWRVLRVRHRRDVRAQCLERVGLVARLHVRQTETSITGDVARILRQRLLVEPDRSARVTGEQALVARVIRGPRLRDGGLVGSSGGGRGLGVARLVVVLEDDALAADLLRDRSGDRRLAL